MVELQKNKYYHIERVMLGNKHYAKLLLRKYGKCYSDYRQKWARAASGRLATEFPLHIDLDTIDSCNLQCIHCQEVNTRKRTHKKISLRLLDGIFKEASAYGICAINIGSIAEPLLEKDILFYILKLTQDINVMETFIHTNGLLLDEDTSRMLIDTDLTYLCISVDASSEQMYKKIRGGDFGKLRNNIAKFVHLRRLKKEVFPLLRLSFLVQEDNYSEKESFLRVWSKFADIIDYQSIIDYQNYNPKQSRPIFPCFSPFARLMIGLHGEIGACCSGLAFKDDLILGHYPQTSIYEAWNGEKIKRIRRAMLKLNLDKFPTCLDCLKRRRVI